MKRGAYRQWISALLIAAMMMAAAPSVDAQAVVYKKTDTYFIVSGTGNRVLDIARGSTRNTANAQIYQQNGTAAQQFRIEKIGKYYRIVNVKSGKVLDVEAGSKKNKANVRQYHWNGTKAQLWKFESAGSGSYYIVNVGSGKALDVAGGRNANGVNVRQYQKNKTKAQKWTLKKAEKATAVQIYSPLTYPYMHIGQTVSLSANIKPANASREKVWSSSDTSVATVNQNGIVTARDYGRAVITAKTTDGTGKKATYTVHVVSLEDENIELIAHRGYSAKAPENSAAAFVLANGAQFDGCECDVRKTKDGVFVVSHDRSLKRMFGYGKNIEQCDYEEIRNLPAVGGNGLSSYPNEPILTLEDYLSIMKESGRRAIIEIKEVWSQEDTNEFYDLVSSYGINDRVEFISYEGEALMRLRESSDTYETRRREEIEGQSQPALDDGNTDEEEVDAGGFDAGAAEKGEQIDLVMDEVVEMEPEREEERLSEEVTTGEDSNNGIEEAVLPEVSMEESVNSEVNDLTENEADQPDSQVETGNAPDGTGTEEDDEGQATDGTEEMHQDDIEVPVCPAMSLISVSNKTIDWAIMHGFDLCLHYTCALPDTVQYAQACGAKVTVWTVDQFDVAYYFAHDLGVRTITSNRCLYGD